MKIEIKNIGERRTLEIDTENIEKYSYKINMILNNHIEGTIKPKIVNVDNKSSMVLDITSVNSISEKYGIRKMGIEDIRSMIKALKNLAANLQEYLLSLEDIIIDSKYIYMNQSNEYLFVTYPNATENIYKSFRELFNYLLMQVDYGDKEAVKTIYRIQQVISMDYFTLELIEECLKNEQEELMDNIQDSIQEEINYDSEETTFIKEVGKLLFKKNRYKTRMQLKNSRIVLKNIDTNEIIKPDKFPFVIGSQKEKCDYCISDKTVSRRHIRLVESKEGLSVQDLNSTNHTYVNDEIIEKGKPRNIKEGDIVSLANVRYIVRLDNA